MLLVLFLLPEMSLLIHCIMSKSYPFFKKLFQFSISPQFHVGHDGVIGSEPTILSQTVVKMNKIYKFTVFRYWTKGNTKLWSLRERKYTI